MEGASHGHCELPALPPHLASVSPIRGFWLPSAPGSITKKGIVFSTARLLVLSRVGDALNDVKGAVKWVSFRFPGSFWR